MEWDNTPEMKYCPFCGKEINMKSEEEQFHEILKRVNQ